MLVSTTAQASPSCYDMKTAQGVMGKEMVSVLRDTGCTEWLFSSH